jgi:hypothetical protein
LFVLSLINSTNRGVKSFFCTTKSPLFSVLENMQKSQLLSSQEEQSALSIWQSVI